MKTIKAIISAILTTSLILTSIPAAFAAGVSPTPSRIGYEPAEAIVTFHAWVTSDDIERFTVTHGVELKERIESTDSFVIATPAGMDARNFVGQISSDPLVASAQLNIRYHVTSAPNDEFFGQQWSLSRIQAADAWNTSQGNNQIIVAVIDTGIDPTHPDLAGSLVQGFDFVNNDEDPNDDNGHGTHVAGIIAASGNNGQGVAGIAWQTKVMSVRALNAQGIGSDATVASAIIWAADHSARIVNLSVGGTVFSQVMQDAINNVAARGVIVVSAAGNEALRNNPRMYPAAYDNVIAVGATDGNDERGAFSSFGDFVDVSAPGVNVLSTSPGGQYVWRTGTSMAAPMVSGLAALVWGLQPTMTSQQVVDAIENTVDDIGLPGKDNEFGFGRINAAKAVGIASGFMTATGSTGEVYGRVVNVQGQSIQGTVVRIENALMPTTTTGEFRFTGLASGIYTIYYDAPGYIGQKQENIAITSGGTARPPQAVLSSNGQNPDGANIVTQSTRMIKKATLRVKYSKLRSNRIRAYR